MYLAKVIGNVEARMREHGFTGKRLLLLQPIDFEGNPIRWVIIALDAVAETGQGAAGVGSIVTFVEGREAANPFIDTPTACDACVTSIVDTWEYQGQGK